MLLPKWTAALTAMRAGSRNAKLVCMGDSTTAGAGARGAQVNAVAGAYPTSLAAIFRAKGTYANSETRFSDANFTTFGTNLEVYDARVTQGGYGPQPSISLGGLLLGSAGGAPLTFTPSVGVDTFEFYWMSKPNQGVMTVDVDGANPVVLNAGAAVQGQHKLVVSAGAVGSHTLRVTPTSGSTFFLGIVAYVAAQKEVTVFNCGHCAGLAEQLSGASDIFSPLSVLKYIEPDLTLVCLTVAQAQSGVPIATYQPAMEAIIAAAQVSGDVVVIGGAPADTVAISSATAALYYERSAAAAWARGAPMIFAADALIDHPHMTARGQATDLIHPSGAGYTAFAQFVADSVPL